MNKNDFLEHYETGQVRLVEIWEEIGLPGSEIEERNNVFSSHLISRTNQIVAEEENMRSEIVREIEGKQEELDELCRQLELPLYEPDVQQKLLKKQRDLSEKVDYLRGEREKKMEQMAGLLEADQRLCDVLAAIPYYHSRSSTPTQKTISEIKLHIEMLKSQKTKREAILTECKQRIERMLSCLQISPASQFECDVVVEADESFVPTSENMKLLQAFVDRLEKRMSENKSQSERLRCSLKALWEELGTSKNHREVFMHENAGVMQRCIVMLQEEVNRCKVMKLQNAKKEVETLRQELTKIWDKCYIGGDERRTFAASCQEDIGTELVETHKTEMSRMRAFFRERQPLIDRVKHYDDLWEQYLQFETKASNADRLFDKGWSLLKEEQERKKIQKELPKLELDVAEEIQAWESNTGKQFRVLGEEFGVWVRAREDELKEKKEDEKTVRQQHKQRQLELEMLYGSKSTPKKRIFTPAKNTTSKSRRVLMPSNHVNTPPRAAKQPTLNLQPHPTSTTFLLSETIVSSHQIHQQDPQETIAPIDIYTDFEILLNEQVRGKTRSSMMPHPGEQ